MVDVSALLATNLRRGRERLSFSQARVAEECGLSSGYISEIETGHKFPSAENLSKIARALGMRPAELFYEDSHWELRERHDSIARYAEDAKAIICQNLDDLTRRHLLE